MPRIKFVFWNEREQRIRAGWRILIYTLLWIFGPAQINVLVGRWLVAAWPPLFPAAADLVPHVVAVLIKLVVVLIGTWLAAHLLDRRPFADFGLNFDRGWWLDFGFGSALGALLMSLIFLIEWLAEWVTIVEFGRVALPGITWVEGIVGALFFFLVVSVTEELLARGYQLRNLAEGLNGRGVGARPSLLIAWAVSSLLFGLLHLFNPNATWYAILGLALAGFFLGYGYLVTGNLAIPIGVHLTWNFFQGNIFGFPVSGNVFDSVTLFAIQQSGPSLWTGGAFGPEAGLLGYCATLLGIGLTALWVRQRRGRAQVVTALAEYRGAQRPQLTAMEIKRLGD